MGVEPTDPHQALDLAALPVCVPRQQYDVRESNPPGLFERQATSPEVERRIQVPSDTATAEGEGVEPSRACASPRFERGAVTHRLALPQIVELRRQESNLRPPG